MKKRHSTLSKKKQKKNIFQKKKSILKKSTSKSSQEISQILEENPKNRLLTDILLTQEPEEFNNYFYNDFTQPEFTYERKDSKVSKSKLEGWNKSVSSLRAKRALLNSKNSKRKIYYTGKINSKKWDNSKKKISIEKFKKKNNLKICDLSKAFTEKIKNSFKTLKRKSSIGELRSQNLATEPNGSDLKNKYFLKKNTENVKEEENIENQRQKIVIKLKKPTSKFDSKEIYKVIHSTKYTSDLFKKSPTANFRINRNSLVNLRRSRSGANDDSKAVYNLKKILVTKDDNIFGRRNFMLKSQKDEIKENDKKDLKDFKSNLLRNREYERFIRNVEKKLKRLKSRDSMWGRKKSEKNHNFNVKKLKNSQVNLSKKVAFFNMRKDSRKGTSQSIRKNRYSELFSLKGLKSDDKNKPELSEIDVKKKIHPVFNEKNEEKSEVFFSNSSLSIAQNCLKILHDNLQSIKKSDKNKNKPSKLSLNN